MNNRRQSGLTLLEMLVVISLTAMLSTLLFQGYGYMLGRYDYVKNRQSLAQRALLAHTWFRETAESMVPYTDGASRFSGDRREFAGTSYASLFGPVGVPTPVRWVIEDANGTAALWYSEGGQAPMRIWRWPPGSSARFRFRDRVTGEWSDEWSVGQPEQLPSDIQLVISPGDVSGETVTASVATRTRQEVYSDDILFGRE